ncbi:MAG TPA: hypothetical protein VEY67_03815 [Candidatus Dormibacteraeota bacterium]|nr:hypothetical protein [Candidatus Dormibacteraeota bacterium]
MPRLARAIGIIFVLILASASSVYAATDSKSINTTTGECTGGGCGAAVYGSSGFSGRLYGSGAASLADYICTHHPGDGAFDSYGGTYTLTISSNGSQLAQATYTVSSGWDCTADSNAAAGHVTFTYPASGHVDYTVWIAGVTSSNAQALFSGYNSILNRVVSTTGRDHANSPSVAPPGPGGEVPEVPAAALLILTGGLGAAWFLLRRRGQHVLEAGD